MHSFFKFPAYIAQITLIRSLENDIGLDTQNHTRTLKTILLGKHISPFNYQTLLNIIYNYLSQTNKSIIIYLLSHLSYYSNFQFNY